MQAHEKTTLNKELARFRGSRRDFELDNMLAEFPSLKQEILTLKAEIVSLNAKLQALKEQKKDNTRSFV
jgi:hypothetical protein